MAALSTFIKNAVCGALKAIDGAGTELVIPYEQGNCSFGELLAILNEIAVYESRGKLRGLGVGARVYPEVSFDAWLTEFSNTLVGAMPAFLLKHGAYSGNVSTQGTSHPVYTVHLEWKVEGTTFGDDADQTLRFEHFRPSLNGSESMDGNGISVKGKVYGRVLLNGVLLCGEVS